MDCDNIYLGDAYELIKQVPDKSIDLIVTDPPYKICAGGSGGCFGVEHRSYHNEYKVLGKVEHKEEGLKEGNRENRNCVCVGFDLSILDEFVRVMKKINIYIWCNKNQIYDYLTYFVKERGCEFEIIVWHKTNPIPTCSNKYLSDLEYCLFFKEPGVKVRGTYSTLGKLYETVVNKADKALYDHPTIKPQFIIENLIVNSSGGVHSARSVLRLGNYMRCC
jgi:DNA modification methylase